MTPKPERTAEGAVKAISLTQPYATAMVLTPDVKRNETRSWATKHRGPLAIHAAKGFPKWAREFAAAEYFAGTIPYPVPLSGVVGVVEVFDCVPTEEIAPHLSPIELRFGDYTPGRWAWLTKLVERFETPIPARGALGLWEWVKHD
jgi:hypothetical protein